jgi:hypothetical protein
MNKTVYLYGPITGLNYAGAQDWRTWMAVQLAPHGINAVSPLRFKHYLARLSEISGHGREYSEMGALSTAQGVLARDKFDVLRADMLLGNFLEAKTPSIGSMFEQSWAHMHHKPIAVAIEEPGSGNPHDHMFFNSTVGFSVRTLEALRDIAIAVLA